MNAFSTATIISLTTTWTDIKPGAALAREVGRFMGPDPPAPIRDTREIDANPMIKFNNAPSPIAGK